MYSKQEASQLRQDFWTIFGKYMSPVFSSEGEKINWINYKTGVKGIGFSMHADNKAAEIGIDITHKDTGIQELYFEQFRQFQKLLEDELQEKWKWQLHVPDANSRTISRIYTQKNSVSIFQKEHWPELISFFKPRIIAMDRFWNQVKYGFEDLGS
jgi:hypothetical protein